MSGGDMKLYVFSAPQVRRVYVPEGYTSGVTVSLAKTRKEAISKVLAKVESKDEMDRIFDVHLKGLASAYNKVFQSRDFSSWSKNGGWAVKVEGSDIPFPEDVCEFEWQKVWNALLPFPDNDDDRVIYKALHDALPPRMQFCNFGAADGMDTESLKRMLEGCNVLDGSLVVTDCVNKLQEFVIIQGGGD